MVTKLHAAQIATEAGCEMVIANGWNPDLLYGIVEGEPIGTRFLAKEMDEQMTTLDIIRKRKPLGAPSGTRTRRRKTAS